MTERNPVLKHNEKGHIGPFLLLKRMLCQPVVSNILAPAHPDPVILLDIVQETLQRAKLARTAQ